MWTTVGRYPWALSLATLVTVACSDAGAPETLVRFSPDSVGLGTDRAATVLLLNDGDAVVGPIVLVPHSVTDAGGNRVDGPAIVVPAEVGPVAAGSQVTVSVALAGADGLPAGAYGFSVAAQLAGTTVATLAGSFEVEPAAAGPTIAITDGPADLRQGDVVTYVAGVRDALGEPVAAAVEWSVVPASAGLVTSEGQFVAYDPGTLRIVARSGPLADTVQVAVTGRGLTGAFHQVGAGVVTARFTSDLWVANGAAYTGTWSVRTVNGVSSPGNTLYVWDVGDPANPVMTDSVVVDARVVNDVKIAPNGAVAVLTHEGSSDGLNGVTLLDLADPLHPTVVSRFTNSLTHGVHNVWLEDDYLFVAVDGASASDGLRIVDITDPSNPTIAADFYAGSSLLHDVYVRDGLAFLSHWDAGLVILDVGNGVRGGTADGPVEVGRVETDGGDTHNAWYWPGGGYVFVGEEDFNTPGGVHVVDVRDLAAPVEVASLTLSGSPPHNFWVDEARAILYVGWYGLGLVAVDVSGTLMGDLGRQGRIFTALQYGGAGACPSNGGSATCSWAPQLEGGLVYVSDMNRGLVIFDPDF